MLRNIFDRLILNYKYETIEKHLTDSNVGGRKGRNIRDNIFVINAIINSIKNGEEEGCDFTLYDIDKCFDSLWAQETINTLYESGVRNDKLVLLYEERKRTKIAIKMSIGLTEPQYIQNVIMQGSIFGSIMCTTVMDKLAKLFYSEKHFSINIKFL